MSNFSFDLPELGAEALRVIHGRGNCVPGAEAFNLEWLPPLALIVAYEPLAEPVLAALLTRLQGDAAVKSIYLQQRDQPGAPVQWLWGEAQTPSQITEHGLHYQVDIGTNQNFGLFLDMAAGRQWVQQRASGKTILNLFSYTCGFAVAALAGGAELVVNLDMSQAALNVGRNNLRLNQLDVKRAKFFAHDLFKSWGKLRKFGPYDLVIADPPSMQKGSFLVEKDYQRIVRQLPSLLSDNGQALLCLNAPWLDQQFLLDCVANEAPELRFVEALARPDLVLEKDADAGLKVLLFERAAAVS
ncbi:class I SAM-dependent methyltransferase [Aliagarivorans marinus]|uniref:class I SAM-dependent methyltransferase n=1 Tax=Aliagarivorans marinus TaxID=561965 RepID=UPI000410129F|nr:class I SAM-dependent methyltransferase [Aliagarivorans marinus]